MVRILIEISLPAETVGGIRDLLRPEVLPAGVHGHLEDIGGGGGCGGLVRGGDHAWVPCWLSLRCEGAAVSGLPSVLSELRDALVDAARRGNTEIFALPAAVQLDDRYLRVRDVGDVPGLLAGTS